jgi:hypothetical protein
MSGSRPPDLIAALERRTEILPAEKLRKLQKRASEGDLTGEDLAKELGEQGMLLVTFALASANEPAILRAAPKDVISSVAELEEAIQESAPALFEHTRIRTIAENMARRAKRSHDGGQAAPSFDDLEGIRLLAAYLDFDGKLTPVVRATLEFSNREPAVSLSLRLMDLAFLITALTSSLAEAVDTAGRLAQAELLDTNEIAAVHKHMADLTKGLDRLEAGLRRPALASSGTTD